MVYTKLKGVNCVHAVWCGMCSFRQCVHNAFVLITRNQFSVLQKDITGLAATLDGLKNSYGGNVSGFLQLHKQAGADQIEAVKLMDQLKNAQKVQK